MKGLHFGESDPSLFFAPSYQNWMQEALIRDPLTPVCPRVVAVLAIPSVGILNSQKASRLSRCADMIFSFRLFCSWYMLAYTVCKGAHKIARQHLAQAFCVAHTYTALAWVCGSSTLTDPYTHGMGDGSSYFWHTRVEQHALQRAVSIVSTDANLACFADRIEHQGPCQCT